MIGVSPLASQIGVAALAFTDDGQTLFIAYSREPAEKGGQVFQVRLSDWQVLNAFEVDSLSARFTRFSGDGKLIASFKPVECPSKSIGFCAEPKVWNTTTGDLISIPRYPTANLEDIDFDKQGRWLMTVGGNLEVFDPTHAFTGSSFGIESEEPENIVAGTFNGVGNLIAYGTEQRSVGVEGWDGQTFRFAYELNLGVSHSDQPGKSRIDVRPTKLALSPSHK